MAITREDITLATPVDELVEAHPAAVGFLADHHVVCILCGEPYWGTLGDLMAQKNITEPEALLDRLNEHLTVHAGD